MYASNQLPAYQKITQIINDGNMLATQCAIIQKEVTKQPSCNSPAAKKCVAHKKAIVK